MENCRICGSSALFRCIPCKRSFCGAHKTAHKKDQQKEHVFKELKPELDLIQSKKIAENLLLKIKKVKEFEGKIIIETGALIQKINQLCMNSIEKAKERQKHYTHLLYISQKNRLDLKNLRILQNELQTTVGFNLSTPNLKEVQDFYGNALLEESIFGTPRKEKGLKKKPLENVAAVAKYQLMKENIKKLYAKALKLDKEYKHFFAEIKNKIQEIKHLNILKPSEIESIFISDPRYVPKPNEIQSEVKAIYTTIRENIGILSDINNRMLSIINSTTYEEDIVEFRNLIMGTTIPHLEIGKESCRNFLEFITESIIRLIISGGNTYQFIKISNDRNFYFFCRF